MPSPNQYLLGGSDPSPILAPAAPSQATPWYLDPQQRGTVTSVLSALAAPLTDAYQHASNLAQGRGDFGTELASGLIAAGGLAMPEARAGGAAAEAAEQLLPRAVRAAEWSTPHVDPIGILAYHGSPHDFAAEPGYPLGRFRDDKIGTGEGNQAFGYGHYAGGAEKTADTYRKNLTSPNFDFGIGRSKYNVFGNPLPSGMSGHMAGDTFSDMDQLAGMLKYQKDTGYSDTGVANVLRQRLDQRIARFRDEDAKGWHQGSAGEDMRNLANFYDENLKYALPKDVTEARPGKMYEVNINSDPEHFLDWDKPLSEQSAKVKSALTNAAQGNPSISHLVDQKSVAGERGNMPASAILGAMRSTGVSDEGISGLLREAGVPGIKYLDQGSRQPKILYNGAPIPKDNHAAKLAAEKLDLHGSSDNAIASLDRDATEGHPYIRDASAQAADLLRNGTVAKHQPEGTHNYVVFDPSTIDIIRKYGIAALMGGGAAAAGAGMVPQPAQAGQGNVADTIRALQSQ